MIGKFRRWTRAHEPLRAWAQAIRLVAVLGVWPLFVGCGAGNDPASGIAAANNSNVRRLSNLYQAYRLRNDSRGPKDQAQLIAFLQQGMAPERLERMGIDPSNIEGLFLSDRDGEPLVIRYGVDGGLGAVDAVVFEGEGRDGQRQVGFTDGSVQEVDDDRYQQLFEGGARQARGTL